MKRTAMLMIAIVGLLSGCIAYEVQDRDRGMHHPDRDRDRETTRGDHDRDRDRDGVPDRQDRRPSDPGRY
jgi:hypothetical protein